MAAGDFCALEEAVNMFREMRRKRQQLPEAEAVAVLERGSSGVLAVLGDGGYPYAVPLSYVYSDGKLYFHCAKSGHKLDAVRECDKASFCVVARDDVVPEEFTTRYVSVIAFGRVRELTGDDEKIAAVRRLAEKYAPELSEAAREAAIERDLAPLCMLELNVEHLTGKQARELLK